MPALVFDGADDEAQVVDFVTSLNSIHQLRALGHELGVVDAVLDPSRVWWGGSVIFRVDERRPLKGQTGPILWKVYDSEVGLTVDDIIAAHRALAPCMSSLASRLAFLPISSAQLDAIGDGAALDAAGVAVIRE